MVVRCQKCHYEGPAREEKPTAFSALLGRGPRYQCARCGGEDLRKLQYCTKCGHVGVPDIENVREFSVALLFVLLLLGAIPGLIYLAFGGSSQDYYVCTECKGRLVLIPVDSPVAQSALEKKAQPQNLEASGKAGAFCGGCGQPVPQGGRYCGSCGQAVSPAVS